MARMTRTIISLPEEEKKWVDAYGKRHRISSAQVVRLAVRGYRGRKHEGTDADVKAVREERESYGPPRPCDLTEMAELKRRAAAAAGRFASGVPDLSVAHDQYLAEEKQAGRAKKGGRAR
jgi:hypothetical protein